ncbi:MAG TPA: TatD family hydrolase [Dehalococcoidales bacterium]
MDTHAHLDMKEFAGDRDEVVTRALAMGVTRIISVGTDIASSEQAIALAEKYPQIYAAVGIHPHDAGRVESSYLTRLAELAKHPKVVAIGEIGLDFYRNYSPKEAQFSVLRGQLELAAELSLPIIIHARQSAREMIEILSDWVNHHKDLSGKPRGVIHCFSEDTPTARKYLELGFYISFPGFVSYPQSRAPAVAKTIPIDKILVETDCPFLTPQKYRGKRNEPSYVALTAETLAISLGMPLEKFAGQTTENAQRLFKF